MKIIKAGAVPPVWPCVRWTCDHCGCVFQPEEGEVTDIEARDDWERDQGHREATHLARIDCPCCGYLQISYGEGG